jgi:hypothetical protein
MKQLIKEQNGTTMMSVFDTDSYSVKSIEVSDGNITRTFTGPNKFSFANMFFETLTGRGPKRGDLNPQGAVQVQL